MRMCVCVCVPTKSVIINVTNLQDKLLFYMKAFAGFNLLHALFFWASSSKGEFKLQLK